MGVPSLAGQRLEFWYLCRSFVPMFPVVRFACFLRYALLTFSVLLSLSLNLGKTNDYHQASTPHEKRAVTLPVVEQVKQKVVLEATLVLNQYVTPPALAWLPAPAPSLNWVVHLRRALAGPRLLAGVGPAEVFRARLLGGTLSPQAP